tara:strand:+ start:24 stop:506 length:483 start_codon:yes stop_codon:yes gene_type:complete
MKQIYYFLGIFIALAITRFIPHPPNFTSLIALSFYVPLLFGIRFVPIVLISFVITDLIIGFHSTLFFTWGSVILIGLISKFFAMSLLKRLGGAFSGACIFFVVTNFGVWINGSYGYNIEGLIACYTLALPFFGYTAISTLIFSALIETIYKFAKFSLKKT